MAKIRHISDSGKLFLKGINNFKGCLPNIQIKIKLDMNQAGVA
jgi:hypothetical protein